MNRRAFLGLFGASAAALVLDPEMLLWRPGAKTIFLPSVTPAPSSLTLGSGVFQVGDIITIDGVYSINPALQEFRVTSVTTSGTYTVDREFTNSGPKMLLAQRTA